MIFFRMIWKKLCFFLRLSVWLRASRKPEGRGGLLAAPLFSTRFVFLFVFVFIFVFFGSLFSNQSGYLSKRRCIKINQPPFTNSSLHPNQQSKFVRSTICKTNQTNQTYSHQALSWHGKQFKLWIIRKQSNFLHLSLRRRNSCKTMPEDFCWCRHHVGRQRVTVLASSRMDRRQSFGRDTRCVGSSKLKICSWGTNWYASGPQEVSVNVFSWTKSLNIINLIENC